MYNTYSLFGQASFEAKALFWSKVFFSKIKVFGQAFERKKSAFGEKQKQFLRSRKK
jgi:hypothetical protein